MHVISILVCNAQSKTNAKVGVIKMETTNSVIIMLSITFRMGQIALMVIRGITINMVSVVEEALTIIRRETRAVAKGKTRTTKGGACI